MMTSSLIFSTVMSSWPPAVTVKSPDSIILYPSGTYLLQNAHVLDALGQEVVAA